MDSGKLDKKIPPIIHYCWYGGGEKPDNIIACMNTWKLLEGYRIMPWNDENSDDAENEFVSQARKLKKWAMVSDYYRLKRLYEYGGIYLDTDVRILKPFDNLLCHDMFLGFIYDCSIGTAVIGAKKGHPFIKRLLKEYDNLVLREDGSFGFKDGTDCGARIINNNDLITFILKKEYPQFLLNNRYQVVDGITIFPKEYFETGSMLHTYYSVHECTGSWLDKDERQERGLKGSLRKVICGLPFIHGDAVLRHITYRRMLPVLPFYKWYLEDKKRKL